MMGEPLDLMDVAIRGSSSSPPPSADTLSDGLSAPLPLAMVSLFGAGLILLGLWALTRRGRDVLTSVRAIGRGAKFTKLSTLDDSALGCHPEHERNVLAQPSTCADAKPKDDSHAVTFSLRSNASDQHTRHDIDASNDDSDDELATNPYLKEYRQMERTHANLKARESGAGRVTRGCSLGDTLD